MDPNNTPALQSPPGQVTNLSNPYSLRSDMYVAAGVGLGISSVAVILRVFTKVRVLRSMQLEDYILVLSLLGFFAFTFLMIHAVHLGQGTHQWNVSVAHLQQVIQIANIIEIIYCPVILGAKVAILLQMRRMFIVKKTGKLFWLHEILLWTNILCYVTLTLTFAFACVPREKLWKPELQGHCISSNGSLIGSSSLNVVSDVSMLLLPLSVILRLKLPLKSKLILSTVFGTGVLACISSTFRLVYGIRLTTTDDFTWSIAPVGFWAIGEICTVILAGSIPMLPGFVKFVRGRDEARSGSSLPRSRSRWPHLSNATSKHHPIPNEYSQWEDSFARMGASTDAHVSASALIDPETEVVPLSIMKTVHVVTKSS